MVQQDNKPNLETTVDGKPLFPPQDQVDLKASTHKTHEYVQGVERDDDPLLSQEERANTRADNLNESVDSETQGNSHPI